jgi:hypothetical protein
MKMWIVIILLFSVTYCQGQELFHRLYTGIGYETNFDVDIINLNLECDFMVPVFSKFKIVTFGAGADFWINNDFLFDTKISYSISQEYVCHWSWNETYSALFIACHYKFLNQFNKQYICPELGYNVWTSSRFFLTPSLSYYFNLKSNDDWKESVYLGFKIKYLLSKRT